MYRFKVTAIYLSKGADFNPPHLHLAPPFGVIPFEFRGYLWHQKTRVFRLSCGVVCMIVCLAVLIEYRRVTNTHTHTHDDSIHCASIASRGKITLNRSRILAENNKFTTFGAKTETDGRPLSNKILEAQLFMGPNPTYCGFMKIYLQLFRSIDQRRACTHAGLQVHSKNLQAPQHFLASRGSHSDATFTTEIEQESCAIAKMRRQK